LLKVLRHHLFSGRTFPAKRQLNVFYISPMGAKSNLQYSMTLSLPGRLKMSGLMEILLIVAIILGIFTLPGFLRRRQKNEIERTAQGLSLTGGKRLAILSSLLWPALLALFLKPWDSHWEIFLYTAVGPVVLAWSIFWVLSGFKKQGK
jgi:hypothetical protein